MNFGVALADSKTYTVSATQANIFESPDQSSTVVATLSHKDEVQVDSNGDVAIVYDGEGASVGFDFYFVTCDAGSGYVFCDLLSAKSTQLTQIPNFNAETNADTLVYDSNFTSTGITLEKGTRIYLYEGYDADLALTAISFLYQDEVQYGYILTTAISPDGLNPTIIVCAVLIIAVLGIIFAWLFIKNKQRKIKKEGKKVLKEQKKQKKAEKLAKKQQKKNEL